MHGRERARMHTHARERETEPALSLSRTIAPSASLARASLISHMPHKQDARERAALEKQLQEARDGAEERETEW
jgi:hypothetical protein